MGEVHDGEDAGDEALEGEELDDSELGDDDLGDGNSRVLGDDEDGSEPARLAPLEREGLAEILEFLAKGLVDNPDAVSVNTVDREGGVTLRLSVDQPDMGKVIGRAGRTAKALRTLMRAAGVRAGLSTHVEIVEESS